MSLSIVYFAYDFNIKQMKAKTDIPGCDRIITKIAVWSFQINQVRKNRQFGVDPDYRPRPGLITHMKKLH